MQIAALTGGIASGKSTVCRLLQQWIPGVEIFDCDASVHILLDSNPEVIEEVTARFGPQIITPDGRIDRTSLRACVFEDPAAREALEAILLPRVRQECLDSRDHAAKRGAELFVADVPLLFERGFDFGQTQVLVVASSHSTQIQRLKTRSGLDEPMIRSILAAQLPVQEKISRADIVFWNEGPPTVLRSQVRRFSQAFLMTLPNETESAESTIATNVVEIPAVPASIDINQFRLKSLAE